MNKTAIKTDIFYLLALLLTAIIILNNAFYGFGWTDEALYCATVNSIYHGQKLFFDISEPTQCYSVLLLPIYSLFLKIQRGGDGIYLLMRIFTISCQFITSVILYFTLRKTYTKQIAFVSSAVFLIFSRAQLFGPSYYTFVLINFTLALCFLLLFKFKPKKYYLFISGIFFGFSILCNPYIVLFYALFSLLAATLPFSRKHIKLYIHIWIGTLLVGIIFTAYVLYGSNFDNFHIALENFLSSPEYSSKSIILQVKRILKFPRLLITQFVYFLPFTILAFMSFFRKSLKEKINSSNKIRLTIIILLLINYAIEIFFIRKDNGMPVTGFLCFAILNYTLFGKKKIKEYQNDIFYFLIPGFTLSFAECIASDTGFGVFSIGIVLCMPFALHIYFDTFSKPLESQRNEIKFHLLVNIPICLLILCTLYYRINLPYRDQKISPHFIFIPSLEKNISKIDRGPAKNIWTHSSNKFQYDKIYEVIKNIDANENDSFMILKLCPWAYLVNEKLTPFSMTAWRLSDNDSRLKRYFEDLNHKLPEHILILNKDIRDNYDNKPTEDSYLLQKIKESDYVKTKVECGYMYDKKRK